MRRGDIVFVKGKGIISKLVSLVDGNGRFSHVSIAVFEDRVIESNLDTKVAIREFDAEMYSDIEVIDLGLTTRQRREVYFEAKKLIGKKYDYIQLFWYLIRKPFNLKGKNKLNNPNNIICSELVYIVLDKAGILAELGIEYTIHNGVDLTPNELYDLVKFVNEK